MESDRADALDEARDTLARLDRLVQLVEDGALKSLDDAGLIRFLRGFERLRNRLLLAESEFVLHAARPAPRTTAA